MSRGNVISQEQKGANLHRLTSWDLPIPPWAAISCEAFDEFMQEAGIGTAVSAVLRSVTVENAGTVAESIRSLIMAAELPPALHEAVEVAYAQAGAGRVAVRSSAMDEDGSQHSFAGQFDTYLNVVSEAEVLQRLKECWASAFSERSLHYRLSHSLPIHATGMAVVVQQMVPAQCSGVLFTAHPSDATSDAYFVSAIYGLGEGIVSGAVDADTLTLKASTGEVISSEVGAKAERFDARSTSGYDVSEVSASERAALALNGDDLAKLHAAGSRIADLFGCPQDIEWAIADGELWILQSRPVTTNPGRDGELRIWDNANIVESFSGVTSPLTFTFAAMAYGTVYESYARSLRVPREQLRQMDDWLPSLLGHFHGRVYYNLLNWYRLVRISPFYRINRRLLETAMGVDVPVSDGIAESLRPYEFRSRWRRRFSRAVINFTFAWKFLRMANNVRRFTRYFYRSYAVFDKVDYGSLPADETYRRFKDLKRDLLYRWGPMQMLDSTILLSLGALHFLGTKWMPEAPEWLTWAAARPGAAVESVEPARALSALAVRVRAEPDLTDLVENAEPNEMMRALRDAGHDEFLQAVEAYISDHGYRSPDELKLEVPDLREDPASLFLMLRDALHSPSDPHTRDTAQEYLDAHLHGIRRALYEVVRRKASRSLADRERLRFCRTRAFGSAKQILRALGRDLHRVGAIESFDDVFYLRLEELCGVYEGTIAHTELKDLVAVRKRIRERDELMSAPARFETRGGPYFDGNLDEATGWASQHAARTGVRSLRGTPSSPGLVEGRAVVATRPQDVKGGILVAYRTDPGWVAALPNAAGLIIERGSPLTHVAIVARELGVPTIVKMKDATREIETGMLIRMDGAQGTVTILDDPAETECIAETVVS